MRIFLWFQTSLSVCLAFVGPFHLYNSCLYNLNSCWFFSNYFADGNDDVKEPKRPRLAPGASILEQLMTPMLDNNDNEKQEGPLEVVDKDGDTTIIHIPDPRQESKVMD